MRSKRTQARIILLCLLWAGPLLAADAKPPEVKPPDVLAHGNDERFWVGQVTPLPTVPKSVQTTVYDRVVGQDDKWEALARIPARVVELASRGSQAAALLDDGTWMLLYSDSPPFTAGPLPAPARMIALAGGRDAWWAVGVVPGGIGAVVTRPTTASTTRAAQAAAPATQTSTQPAINRLVLFSLTANDWKPVAELPHAPAATPRASVALINESPYVAFIDSAGTLWVSHLSGGAVVGEFGVREMGDVVQFKMLPHSTLPRLWIERQTGPDLVNLYGPKPVPPIQLTPIAGSTPTSRTVAFFSGSIRMVGSAQGKLIEQDFAADTGKPQGAAAALKLPQIGPLSKLQSLQLIVVTVALVIAVLASFRQRLTMRGPPLKLEEIPLAPYGRRLAAGLIDACPLILAMGGALAHFHAGSVDLDPTAEVIILVIYWASGFFYVLYTTVMEVLIGRSIGKVILGLRIISIDGTAPQPAALVTRNLLRLIDVGVFFTPLVMILLFPLRQRPGDVAAGTIVIFGELQKKGDEESADSTQSVEAKE